MTPNDTGVRHAVKQLFAPKKKVRHVKGKTAPDGNGLTPSETIIEDEGTNRELWGYAEEVDHKAPAIERRVVGTATAGEAFGVAPPANIARGCSIEQFAPDLAALSKQVFLPIKTLERWSRVEAPHPTDAERQLVVDAIGGDGVTVDDIFPPQGSQPTEPVKVDHQSSLGNRLTPQAPRRVSPAEAAQLREDLDAARANATDAHIRRLENDLKLIEVKDDVAAFSEKVDRVRR